MMCQRSDGRKYHKDILEEKVGSGRPFPVTFKCPLHIGTAASDYMGTNYRPDHLDVKKAEAIVITSDGSGNDDHGCHYGYTVKGDKQGWLPPRCYRLVQSKESPESALTANVWKLHWEASGHPYNVHLITGESE